MSGFDRQADITVHVISPGRLVRFSSSREMTVHFCEFLVKLCILSAIIVTNDASVYERTVIFSVFKNQ